MQFSPKMTPLYILFPFKHFAAKFPPKFEGQATSTKPKEPLFIVDILLSLFWKADLI